MTPETTTSAIAAPEVLKLVGPAPAIRAARPAQAFGPTGRFPAWLRAVDAIHRADRSPVAIVPDVVVAGGCATAFGASPAFALTMAIGTALLVYLSGGYADRGPLETQGVLWFGARGLAAVAFATLLGVTVSHIAGWSETEALTFGWSAASGLIVLRGLTWMVLARARRRGLGLRRTLIVGHSAQASTLARKLVDFSEAGLLPVAMLPLGNGHGFARFMPDFPSATQLTRSIEESGAEHVVLAPDGSDQAILECVRGSDGLDVSFSILPPLAEFFLHPSYVAQVGGIPLIPLGRIAQRQRTLPGKRLLDLIGAMALLLLLAPIMLVTAAAIKIFDGGPALYRQRRVGRDGQLFEMLKFRSMVIGAERQIIDLRDQNVNNGLLFKVNGDPRITRVGRFIRRPSIDELPQLWNVIRGEMSLVGPRPLPVNPEDFNPIDNKRHTVLPGITGYWQIAGGHDVSYEEMVKLDLAYIENWSVWLDVRLLLRTVPALIHRRGPS